MWFGLLGIFVLIVLFAFGFVWLLGKRFTPEQLESGVHQVAEFPGPLIEAVADRLNPGAGAVSGPEALIGRYATVVVSDNTQLWVEVHGERWRARCNAPVSTRDTVQIFEVDSLTLVVEVTDTPAESSSPANKPMKSDVE